MQYSVVDLPVVQELSRLCGTVIDDLAVAQVKFRDGGHILLAEGEIPNIEVFLHPLFVGGFGNNDYAPLGIPAQGNLGGSFAVLLANLGQHWVGKDAMLTFGHGPPCLRLDVQGLHVFNSARLSEEGVKLHLVYHGLDLSELAQMLTEEYEEIAAERQLTLHADIQPDIHMHADQTLMIRLFANLLQNAITYNREHGAITMTLKQADDIILTVQDTGIGISEEHLPHIWERFYQADPSRSDTESSGLGLSMVKWIVEAHQGTITVSSKLNEGTTFTCIFPSYTSQ